MTPAGHCAHVHLTMTDDHPWAMAFVIIEILPEEPSVSRAATPHCRRPIAAERTTPPRPLADDRRRRACRAPTKQGTDWWARDARRSSGWSSPCSPSTASIAKPFYIPSESMMPGLLKRRPAGGHQISLWLVVGQPELPCPAAHDGRLFGRMPERGDVVIVTPPGASSDYIKRVIGLPGDTIEVVDGIVYPQRQADASASSGRATMIPIDANVPCPTDGYRRLPRSSAPTASSIAACRCSARRCPTARSLLRHDRRRR